MVTWGLGRLRAAVTSVVLILTMMATSPPAYAAGQFRAFACGQLGLLCPTASPPTDDDADAAVDPSIRDETRATKNRNKIQFHTAPSPAPKAGYVRVGFEMIGATDPTTGKPVAYDDANDQDQTFFQRTILDWAKSLFVAEDRTYIVTLSARATNEQNPFWIKPIIAFEYKNGFNLLSVSNTIAFNGDSVFYRSSGEDIEVKLEIRQAKTSNINLDLVKSIFVVANGLSSIIGGPIVSKVAALDTDQYKDAITNIEQKLSEFKTINVLSRSAELSINGDYAGFDYHFFAPTVNHAPFKLAVELQYRESLLEDKVSEQDAEHSTISAASVMASLIKEKDAAAPEQLENYIQSSPISSDADDLLNGSPGDPVKACEKVRRGLAAVFEPLDTSLALLSFVLNNQAMFHGKETPSCFLDEDRVTFQRLHLTLPAGFQSSAPDNKIRPLRPVETRLSPYLLALGTVAKFIKSQPEAIAGSVDFLRSQGRLSTGDERPIRINDTAKLLVADGPRQIFPVDLVDHLRSLSATIDSFGCYERSIYSDAIADPNVVAMLVRTAPQLFVFAVHFDASPPETIGVNEITVSRIDIFEASQQDLDGFKRAYDGKPCRSGWAPWTPQVATATPPAG